MPLCAGSNYTLELLALALPPIEAEIWAGSAYFIIPDTQVPLTAQWTQKGMEAVVEEHTGREGLSWRLFGVPGSTLIDDVLDQLTENANSEAARRLRRLEVRIDALLEMNDRLEEE